MTATAPVLGGTAAGLLRAARPHHWIKNVLVLAAPAAAALDLTDGYVLGRVLLAFVALSLAASGTYLLNDVHDRHDDARHPVKRDRPIASGQVAPATAIGVGVVLLATAIALPALLGAGNLAIAVAVYLTVTTSYTYLLKQTAIIELAFVAAGFVIRAVAGAAAVDVPVSRWFLIVISAGALYLVATKRWAEARDRDEANQRPVLADYQDGTLTEIRFATASVTILAYVLWAFETAEVSPGPVWHELSILPVVLALFRYGAAVHEGAGEAPEEVFLHDRQIQVLGVLWALLYFAGIHGVLA